MAQISRLLLSNPVAAVMYSIGTAHLFASVCVGIMGVLFGVVAVSGTALVIHSSGISNSSVDGFAVANVVLAPTKVDVAEPEVPSTQRSPTPV
jgi:hypothetical protein